MTFPTYTYTFHGVTIVSETFTGGNIVKSMMSPKASL